MYRPCVVWDGEGFSVQSHICPHGLEFWMGVVLRHFVQVFLNDIGGILGNRFCQPPSSFFSRKVFAIMVFIVLLLQF